MSPATTERSDKTSRRAKAEAVILFWVANQMFAIAAGSVQEIRSTDSLAGAANEINQQAVPKVRHILEWGRRTCYVVNAAAHFGLRVTRPTLVLILRRMRIALLVDRIDRMTEIPAVYALPQAFAGKERRWYRGLAYIDDSVIPVVEPSGFLSTEEFSALEFAVKPTAPQHEMEGVVRA
ncbi:MAG TPA: chemotaxis protein CheW [Candidatus Baltobacteraceae bacterium]|jgi:chemotaxis signal transduction protein|nr:chemotaxis protein CheW [Candidatus Baltobacteraceae bacterium]